MDQKDENIKSKLIALAEDLQKNGQGIPTFLPETINKIESSDPNPYRGVIPQIEAIERWSLSPQQYKAAEEIIDLVYGRKS